MGSSVLGGIPLLLLLLGSVSCLMAVSAIFWLPNHAHFDSLARTVTENDLQLAQLREDYGDHAALCFLCLVSLLVFP